METPARWRRALAVLALALAAGCKPAARGLCAATENCRAGAYCSVEGICLSASGDCVPACAEGELCASGQCRALKPAVSVAAPADGLISATHDAVTATVTASPAVALGALRVEVATGHVLAQ